MVVFRNTIRGLAIALVVVITIAAGDVPALASVPQPFGGVVHDTFGAALSRVEVFLVPDPDSRGGAIRATTDEVGRFVVLDLAPGLYRIAAVKEGYGVYLGRVNTGMRSTLDVILHPLPRDGEPGADAVAGGPSWALRVPRRSVWQDVVDAPTTSSVSAAALAEDRGPARSDAIEGSVEQTFAVAAASASGWDGGLQGNATRMAIASDLGDRTRVALGGRRSQLESGGVEGESPGALSASDSNAVDLGVRVRTSEDASLDLRAFWAARDTRITAPVTVDDGFRQAEQVWGYDAAWRQQLDQRSTLAVRMDYAASTVDVPRSAQTPEGDTVRLASPGANVAVSARGSYETVPGDRHQVRVAFGARFVDIGLPVLRNVANGSPVVRMDDAGWNLGIEAEDTWAAHGPLSVIYGLGYHHRLAETDTSVVAPAIGGSWSDGGRSLRVVVTYHAERIWSAPALGDTAQSGASSREAFGYEASAETGLPLGFVLQAATTYAPIGTERIGYELGVPMVDGDRPMYFAEGDSELRETSATLRHDGGRAQVFVQWTRGRVDGALTTVMPFDVPYSTLDDSTLRYRTGRVGIDVASSGTRVLVEHRRLRDHRHDDPATGPLRAQDQVEVRLVQDLLRYPGSSWRLLLSLQAVELDGETLAYAEQLAGQRLPDSHRQVNAGIAVAF
jgi:hypothetical protein